MSIAVLHTIMIQDIRNLGFFVPHYFFVPVIFYSLLHIYNTQTRVRVICRVRVNIPVFSLQTKDVRVQSPERNFGRCHGMGWGISERKRRTMNSRESYIKPF
jgi:hypothetical protein